MPSPWHYPRWRRILMQATLWLALIATTALAALLTHQRQARSQTALGRPITVGPVSLGLPADWAITPGGRRSTVLLRAEEPPRESDDSNQTTPSARTLIVRLFQNVSDDDSAADFLRHSGLLQRATGAPAPSSDDNPDLLPPLPSAARISIGTTPGILVRIYHVEMPADDGQEPTRQAEWIAAALVSDSRALVLQLESPDPDDDSSPALIRAIAATVHIAPAKPPADQPLPSPADRL